MPETEPRYIQDGDEGGGLSTNICSTVLDRWTSLTKHTSELGPLCLFYEIATEAMNQQDSLIEFFSRTLFFFKKKTNLSLSHRKKVAFMRKMHIVISGIQLIHFNIQSVADIINKLVLKAESSAGDVRVPAGLSPKREDRSVLKDAMDSISQLKANNTAMVLSLIATIFLPLTFLAGVFGMNFTVDGGFTISLVNSENGPLVFYLMCAVLFVIIHLFFVSKGWIEPYSVLNYFLKAMFGKRRIKKMIEENDLKSSIAAAVNEVAIQRARSASGNDTHHSVENNDAIEGKRARSLSVTALFKSPASSLKVSRPTPSADRFIMRGSEVKIQEAVEEEMRRAAETTRKRQKAQDVIKLGARNSAMRLSVVANAAPPVQRERLPSKSIF
eukprot:gene24737-31114_t